MADRTELMDSALEASPEGIALVSDSGQVVLWNHAAEEISGFPGIEVIGRRTPFELEPLLFPGPLSAMEAGTRQEHGSVCHLQHKLGREIQVIARIRVLRNDLGERIGYAVIFRIGDRRGQLAASEPDPGSEVEPSREEFVQRIEEAFAESKEANGPFGLVWISVDQAAEMCRSHGTRACSAMLDSLERTLSNHLHTGEEIGRWDDAEFLILTPEATADRLSARMQVFAGLGRTAVFRWWGDRISVTVSAGAALAEPEEDLERVMERAHEAMTTSIHGGGNRATMAPGRQPCSQS